MEPIRFDPDKDLPPTPFTLEACRKAAELKHAGLSWRPHVGCFVWDREEHIQVESPFPNRIYFILSMQRFLQIFVTTEAMVEKLIWLPTWHQSLLILKRYGKEDAQAIDQLLSTVQSKKDFELITLYDILLQLIRMQ